MRCKKVVFNLINDKWIPVRRLDGTREIIAPWQVTDNIGSNPIVALDANRPDFNGALIQFLIGLVQTTMAPKREISWEDKFTKSPEADELKTAFANVSHAFNLDGNSPRFMQDFDFDEGNEWGIDTLLAGMPGCDPTSNPIKNNTDHFLKRGTVKRMCLHCCAMALFTSQTNSPGMGSGHRTSLRGGGPLTTVVMGDTLWQTIWLNVLNESDFLDNCGNSSLTDDAAIFPWMGPTRTSETKPATIPTTPEYAHPAHIFWGMPLRIVLNFETEIGYTCDVCGCDSIDSVATYRIKIHGMNYEGAWRHTLTPYNKSEEKEPISIKGQPGGITFRHWLGLVKNDAKNGNETAIVVHKFRGRMKGFENKHRLQLWAFGYDFDKNKARCWYEGKMPLINVDDDIRENYESVIEQLIKTSEIVAWNVVSCIKKSMAGDTKEVKKYFLNAENYFFDNSDKDYYFDLKKSYNSLVSKKDYFYAVEDRFWNNAEAEFYVTLEDLRIAFSDGLDNHSDAIVDMKLQWLKTLFRIGEQLFDEYSQYNLIDVADPKNISLAHRNLSKFNDEKNKKFIDFLDLPINQSQVNK